MSASVATSITAVTASMRTGTNVDTTAAVSHPCKQRVRAYLARRCQDRCPPPAPEDIRRELGWAMRLATPADPTAAHG